MKVLDLFIEPANTPVTMHAKPNDDVLSYTVFIRKWVIGGQGSETVGTWFPDELESEAGASMTLGAELGYDFILMASVNPKAQAAISIDLSFSAPGAGSFDKPVALPSSEGPIVARAWKVVIKKS